MKLYDLLTSPWAILPDKLREIQAVYATHLRSEKIDIAGIEARLGHPLANEQQEYSIQGSGVGVLPLEGILAPKANLLMRISGGTSTQMFVRQVESMKADSRVRSAVLAVDSPGGAVLGIPAAAAAIAELAKVKPVVAVGVGTIASAAYWLASAANAVFIEGSTDQVGSLGVYQRMGWDPKGENTMEFARGKYKRASLNGEPPSAEFVAYVDEQLDHLYAVLVDAVAQHRGVTAEQVLEQMADGRVFIGQQAVDVGLADGYSTVDAMVEQLSADPRAYAQRRRAKPKALAAVTAGASAFAEAGAAAAGDPPESDEAGAAEAGASTTPPTENTMPEITREAMERDNPALLASLKTEFMAAGVAAELARQAGVRATLVPGHEKLVEQLATDGKTTPAEAALAVNTAVRAAHQAAAKAHADDAPPAAPAAAAPAEGEKKTREQQAAEAQAYAEKHGVDIVAALKALGYAS
jgi:ClpP class serine protease